MVMEIYLGNSNGNHRSRIMLSPYQGSTIWLSIQRVSIWFQSVNGSCLNPIFLASVANILNLLMTGILFLLIFRPVLARGESDIRVTDFLQTYYVCRRLHCVYEMLHWQSVPLQAFMKKFKFKTVTTLCFLYEQRQWWCSG